MPSVHTNTQVRPQIAVTVFLWQTIEENATKTCHVSLQTRGCKNNTEEEPGIYVSIWPIENDKLSTTFSARAANTCYLTDRTRYKNRWYDTDNPDGYCREFTLHLDSERVQHMENHFKTEILGERTNDYKHRLGKYYRLKQGWYAASASSPHFSSISDMLFRRQKVPLSSTNCCMCVLYLLRKAGITEFDRYLSATAQTKRWQKVAISAGIIGIVCSYLLWRFYLYAQIEAQDNKINKAPQVAEFMFNVFGAIREKHATGHVATVDILGAGNQLAASIANDSRQHWRTWGGFSLSGLGLFTGNLARSTGRVGCAIRTPQDVADISENIASESDGARNTTPSLCCLLE